MSNSPEHFNPETHEASPTPELGDYVTAVLAEKTITEDFPEGVNSPRQGVFVKDNGDGTVVLQGPGEKFICKGPEGMVLVPDENLDADTKKQVAYERDMLEVRKLP